MMDDYRISKMSFGVDEKAEEEYGREQGGR